MSRLPPRVSNIIASVAAQHGVRPADVLGRFTRGPIAKARAEAMALVRDLDPQPSFPQIGRWFDRDHTTIIAACRKVGPLQLQLSFDLEAA